MFELIIQHLMEICITEEWKGNYSQAKYYVDTNTLKHKWSSHAWSLHPTVLLQLTVSENHEHYHEGSHLVRFLVAKVANSNGNTCDLEPMWCMSRGHSSLRNRANIDHTLYRIRF